MKKLFSQFSSRHSEGSSDDNNANTGSLLEENVTLRSRVAELEEQVHLLTAVLQEREALLEEEEREEQSSAPSPSAGQSNTDVVDGGGLMRNEEHRHQARRRRKIQVLQASVSCDVPLFQLPVPVSTDRESLVCFLRVTAAALSFSSRRQQNTELSSSSSSSSYCGPRCGPAATSSNSSSLEEEQHRAAHGGGCCACRWNTTSLITLDGEDVFESEDPHALLTATAEANEPLFLVENLHTQLRLKTPNKQRIHSSSSNNRGAAVHVKQNNGDLFVFSSPPEWPKMTHHRQFTKRECRHKDAGIGNASPLLAVEHVCHHISSYLNLTDFCTWAATCQAANTMLFHSGFSPFEFRPRYALAIDDCYSCLGDEVLPLRTLQAAAMRHDNRGIFGSVVLSEIASHFLNDLCLELIQPWFQIKLIQRNKHLFSFPSGGGGSTSSPSWMHRKVAVPYEFQSVDFSGGQANKKEIVRRIQPGQVLDAKDTVQKWYDATVLNYDPSTEKVFIHYNNWGIKWDESLDLFGPRIAPYRTEFDPSSAAGTSYYRRADPLMDATPYFIYLEEPTLNLKSSTKIQALLRHVTGIHFDDALKPGSIDINSSPSLSQLTNRLESRFFIPDDKLSPGVLQRRGPCTIWLNASFGPLETVRALQEAAEMDTGEREEHHQHHQQQTESGGAGAHVPTTNKGIKMHRFYLFGYERCGLVIIFHRFGESSVVYN